MNMNDILLNLKNFVNKQDKNDSRLLTNSKDVVGAINENKSSLEETKNEVNNLEINKAEKSDVESLQIEVNDKASLSSVNNLDSRINSLSSGSPKGVYSSLELLTQAFPNGNSNIYIVGTKWCYWNGNSWVEGGEYQGKVVPYNSVTPYQTTFIENSKNLFIYDTALEGVTISDTGEITVNSDFLISDFIMLNNTENSYKDLVGIALYDENIKFLKRVIFGTGNAIMTGTFSKESNQYYARLISKKINRSTIIFNEGSTLIPYEKGVQKIEPSLIDNESIIIKPQNTTFIEEDSTKSELNIFNIKNSKLNGYYDSTSLNWVEDSLFMQSEFIPCEAGDVILISPNSQYGNMVVFKNEEGTIFKGVTIKQDSTGNPRRILIAEGCKEFSITLRKILSDTFMIVKNKKFPSVYIPFGLLRITDERLLSDIYNYVANLINLNEINPLTDKKIICFGDSIMRGYGNSNKGAVEYIAEKNNMRYRNLAVSGATHGYCQGRSHIFSQMQSVKNEITDYIIFNGLTNDVNNVWNKGNTGVISDGYDAELDINTFCGGFESCCKFIKENWSNAKVLYIAVHKMPSRDKTGQEELQTLARDMCKKWSIPVLDLYNEGNLNTYIEVMFNQYTSNNVGVADGTHPNELGYETFYIPQIESKIKSI